MSYVDQYIQSKDWAILEEYLQLIMAVGTRDTELRDETLEAVLTRYGRPLAGTREVTVRDGVAIIPMIGPVFRYASFFNEISGATSFENLARDFSAAAASPEVERIVLEINSPGGEVDGTSEMAALIRGTEKPVDAFVSHLGASAALWVATAADRVFLADTAMMGSVGVRATVRGDREGKNDAPKMIFVSSQSPKKRLDPFAEGEGGAVARAEIQSRINQLADVFIKAVSEHRGMSPEAVAATEGSMFIGQSAVDAGFADGVTTLEALLTSLSAGSDVVRRPDRMTAAGGTTSMEVSMKDDYTAVTLEQLTEHQPELVDALIEGGTKQGRALGATAERERILAIYDIHAEGFEGLKRELMADAEVTSGEAALRILHVKGEKEQRTKQVVKDQLVADEQQIEGVAPAAPEGTDEMEADAMIASVVQHAENWRTARPGL